MVSDVDSPGTGPAAPSSIREHGGTQERLASLMAAIEAAGVDVEAIIMDENVKALIHAIAALAATLRPHPQENRAGMSNVDAQLSTGEWATGEARSVSGSVLDRILSAAGLAKLDVSEAVFMVMTDAIKGMDDDIRAIMAEIKAMTEAKGRLRELIRDLNQWISQEMSKHPNSNHIDLEKVTGKSPNGAFKVSGKKVKYNEPRPNIEDADLVVECATVYELSGGAGVTIRGLASLLEAIKGKLDSMNEMSEMTSLRLQMAMDRRAKFISTLSNMMKKISTTQDMLVQNIK
ncbi:MAG: hypothetical protein OEQ18_07560 [Gammaproteobacteria bacterium]|nr:hypothetical protein [Gammaproteobacteria bacterium]